MPFWLVKFTRRLGRLTPLWIWRPMKGMITHIFRIFKMAASSACIVGNCLSATRNINILLPSLHKVPKTVIKATLDKSQHQGRRGFLKLLLGNTGLVGSALLSSGNAYADEQGFSNSRVV